MPATPKRSRRFGGDAAHQRLMMANLVASLVAAEAITTTEAKAKALRPIAEKLITKAKKASDTEDAGSLHRVREIQSYLGDKEMTYKLVHEVAPRYADAPRWVHPHPEAGHPPRRQRADGPHRTGVGGRGAAAGCTAAAAGRALAALTERSETEASRARSACWSPTTAPTSTGSPRTSASSPWAARCGPPSSASLGTDVELTVAGRTDAGVHAWGQVVTFDAPAAGLDLERLQRSVNGLCKPAIVVRAAELAPAGLRRPLLGHVAPVPLHGPEPDRARPVPGPHVVAGAPSPSTCPSLRLALRSALRRARLHARSAGRPRRPAGVPPPTLVRRVDRRARGRDLGDGVLRFEIRANAFCHQMVRSLVGLLVDVGRGRRRAGDVLGVLRARDRRGLGNIAPPTGLCLWEVGYPDGFGPERNRPAHARW